MFYKFKQSVFGLCILVLAAACSFSLPTVGLAEDVVVYSGRSKSFMDHLFDRFEKTSGHTVKRVYGKTAEIALKLQAEGKRSPADVVLAQDAGALGALSKRGMLATLPGDLTQHVDSQYISDKNDWVATSLRARTLAYSPKRISKEELPSSVFDLTDKKYKGRVGWAPANASFQAFITAMRNVHGDDKTRQWLKDMKANGAKTYPKNTAIIQAIAAGEIDLGLPNHYYLIRFKSTDPDYPVEQTHFKKGDVGNLVNVAGVGVLKTARHGDAARELVSFLISEEGQSYFVNEIYEYPVLKDTDLQPQHDNLQSDLGHAPDISLNDIDDLPGTLSMLRDAGLL